MGRSKWKGPLLTVNIVKLDKQKKFLEIVNRNSKIMPNFINKTIKIHNGKNYSEIQVTKDMVGHYFGEFVFTRATFSFKKKNQKNKWDKKQIRIYLDWE